MSKAKMLTLEPSVPSGLVLLGYTSSRIRTPVAWRRVIREGNFRGADHLELTTVRTNDTLDYVYVVIRKPNTIINTIVAHYRALSPTELMLSSNEDK